MNLGREANAGGRPLNSIA